MTTPYTIVKGKKVFKVKLYLGASKKRFKWVNPPDESIRDLFKSEPEGDAKQSTQRDPVTER